MALVTFEMSNKIENSPKINKFWASALLCLLVVCLCIWYVYTHGYSNNQIMTGVVKEKYRFNNTSKYGTDEQFKMIITYPSKTVDKVITTDTYYKFNVGDRISFNEIISENNTSTWLTLLAIVAAFGVIVCFIGGLDL